MENPVDRSAETEADPPVPPPPALQDQSTSESLGDSSGPHRPLPPLSPLTGGYLLIVVGEPHSERHKEIILQKIAKAFLSWDVDECHVSLEKELNAITGQAPVGEEARFGERLIQYATENLVTEILIHPQLNTLHQCMKNLLSSFTKHRHIIHAGYTFAGNGSWILQDGTLSISDLIEALHEPEVLRVMKAYENSISIDVHCAPEGDWRTERFQKEPATKLCTIRVNPGDVMTAGNAAISAFIDYLSPFLEPANIQQLLQPTDIVGNIRFTHPTLYVFPGGQGDAALFGINGFNMLIDGGFARKACFWDFARHLDRLDAVLLTRLNNSTVNGISAVLQRKKMNHVYPQIGHFFCNLQDRKIALSPDGDKDKDSLIVNLAEEGHEIVANLRHLALKPHPCYRDGNQIDPVNLYHKVGHGKLDMYVISPARDSQAVKEFLAKWTTNDSQLFSNTGKKVGGKAFEFPLQNLVSICALLVWQPANPNDTITRILFPGSTPQHKIFEGLEKLRHLEFLKHPVCSASSIGPSLAAGAATRSLSKTRPSRIIENKQVESKPGMGKSQARQVRSRSEKTPSREIKSKLDINKLVDEKKEIESNLESPLMKLDNRILSKDEQIENITKEIQKIELAENEDQKKKVVHRSKYDMRYVKSKVDSRAPSKSIDRKKGADKKSEGETSPPATPKKTSVNGTATKKEKAKAGTKPGGKTTLSPPTTPAKSAKEANNRKVVEARLTKTTNKSGTTATTAQKKKEETPPPASAVAPKTERKPISRRPKGSQSPVNKSKGKEGAEAPKKNQIKPKIENVAIAAATGTAAATLAIGKTILDLNKGAETEKTETKEKTTEKTVGEESEIGKPNETDTMAVNKQIEPTKSQETEGGVEEGGEEIEGEEEEYLIITKEEYVEEKEEGEGEGEESLKASGSAQEEQAKDETEEEGEIKKLLREEKESEKKQKAVDESTKDAPIGVKEEEEEQQQQQKKPIDVEKVNEKENEKFDRDERAAKEEEETEPDPQADQKYSGSKEHKEGESLPEEKISNTIETSATTAPTLPEDEKVEIDKAGEGGRQEEEDIVQAEEMVEEKYIQEETKEDKKIDEDVMAVPQSLPKLEFNNAEDAESGLMMQPGQKKPREVVKTPDEVADLPMHEEVDPRMYSSGDYTKELRKRSTEYDSIGVDQISEKGKEKDQIVDSLDYNEEDKEVEKREEKVPKEDTRENKSEDKEEIKENMDDSIASKYLNIIDELEKSAGSISKEVKEDTRVEDATVVALGETKPGESTTEGKEESVDRPVEEHREIPVSIDEAKRDLEEEKFALSQEPSKMTPDKPKSVSNGHEVVTLGENVDGGSPSSLEAPKPNEMPKKDGYREMSPTEHLKGDSNRSSPIETSGKSSPAEMRKYSVEKVKVISQELDEENARKDSTQGQDVWENSDKLEHAQSPIMDFTFCKKEQINLDNILDKNGKDTEGTLHRLDGSQPTFQVAENIEKSDDSVPQNDAMGTAAIGLEEDADGEIVEGSISQKHISEKERSSPVESSEAATKKKLSLTESEDLKKGSQASSGKHTPIDSGDEAETRKNLVESSAEGKPESLLKPSKEISDESFPRDVKASASGETSPTSRKSLLQYVEPLVSGQISQKDSESPPSRKQSLQDVEAPTSGKSSPQRLEGTTSRKSSTQCVEAPISGKSSPSNRIESEASGKISPQNIKESISGESSPQNVTPQRSGKSSPQVVEADRSGSGSPFVEVDATTSGKMSPKGSESSDQALIEKAPPSTYKSGQSSPQVLEEVTSRKSIPLDSEIFPSDKTSPEIASRENISLHPEKQSGKSSPLLPDSMTEPPEQMTVQNETVVRPEGTSPCFDSRRSSKSIEPEPSPQHSASSTKGTIQTGDFSKESFQGGDEKEEEEEKEKKEEKINEIPEKDGSQILKTNAFKEKMTNPQDSSPKSSSPMNSDGDEIDDRQGFLHQIEQSETMKPEFSPSLEEGKDSRKRSVVDEIEGQSPQVSNLNTLEKKSSRTSTRTPSPSSDASVVPTRPEKETEKSENEKFLMAERRASDSPSSEPPQKESSGKSSPATPGKALSPVSGKPTSESVSMALADAATSATFSLEKENLAKSSSPSPVDISPLSLDERKDGAKDEKPEIRSVNVSGEGASPKTLKRIVCEDGNSSGMSTPDRSHIEKSDASVPNGVESEDEIEKGILESEKQEKESQISDVLSEEEEELKGLGVEDDDDDEAAGASDTRNGHFVPGTKNEKEVYDEGMIRSGDSSRGDIRKDEKEDINHLVKIGVRDTDGVQSEDEEVSDLKSEVKRMLVTASSEDGGTETEICIQGGVKTLKEVLAEDEKGPKREEVEEEFSNLILEARKEYIAQRSRKTSTSSPAEPADDVDDNESVESEMGSEREELGSLLMQARQELAFVRSRSRETDERKEPETKKLLKSTTVNTTESTRKEGDIVVKIITKITTVKEEQDDGNVKVTTTTETKTIGGKDDGVAVEVNTAILSGTDAKKEKEDELGPIELGTSSETCSRFTTVSAKGSEEIGTSSRRESQGDSESRRTSTSSDVPIFQEDLLRRKDSGKMEEFRRSSTEMSPLKTTYITSYGESESLMTSSFYGNLPGSKEEEMKAEHVRAFSRKGKGYESVTEIGPNGEKTERTYFYEAEEDPEKTRTEKPKFVKAYYTEEGIKRGGEQPRFGHGFHEMDIPEENIILEETRYVQKFHKDKITEEEEEEEEEDEGDDIRGEPEKFKFVKAMFPAEKQSQIDFAQAVEEHKAARGSSLLQHTEEIEEDKNKIGSEANEDLKVEEKKDVIEGWGKPLRLPLPPKNLSKNYKYPGQNISTTSSLSTPSDNSDSVSNWGQPMNLPSPGPPAVQNGISEGLATKVPPISNKDAPGKEKFQLKKGGENKGSGTNTPNRRSQSPAKPTERRAASAGRIGKSGSNSYIYLDLTYVPHHGNSYYINVEFFKKVRARYYVFSGTEPSKEVYNALLEAKQTWEDKNLEVTIIPTYDTDILGYWVAENEEILAKHKIDLSPSASRCTINLQDHETSCSAYRLEF